MRDIWEGNEGSASFSEGIFTQHHSSSDSEDAPLAFLIHSEFTAPSPWLNMTEELCWPLSPILVLCTCKRALLSIFLCTGSTSHPHPVYREHKPYSGALCTLLTGPESDALTLQKHGHWLLPPPQASLAIPDLHH